MTGKLNTLVGGVPVFVIIMGSSFLQEMIYCDDGGGCSCTGCRQVVSGLLCISSFVSWWVVEVQIMMIGIAIVLSFPVRYPREQFNT